MSGKSPLELLNIVPMLPEHREELAADTLDPHRISETSSILLVDTPARYISIMASSTEVSRRL